MQQKNFDMLFFLCILVRTTYFKDLPLYQTNLFLCYNFNKNYRIGISHIKNSLFLIKTILGTTIPKKQ